MPQAWITRMPSASKRSSKLSGTADPPHGTARRLERSKDSRSRTSSMPRSTVGTPAVTVTRRSWMSCSEVARRRLCPGVDLRCAHHGGAERQSPGVGVEHRDHGHDPIGLAEPEGVRHRLHEALQDERTMGIDDALRMPGGAGGVAHAGGVVLVERRPVHGVGGRCQQVLVAMNGSEPCRGQRSVAHHDEGAHRPQGVGVRLELRHQRVVHEEHGVGGVVHDVGDLVREEPDVDGVQHGTARRHGEVELEVTIRVPGEGADAIAASHAQRVQRICQPARAPMNIAVGVAVQPARRAGDDLLRGEEERPPLEDRTDGEGGVHHETAHGFPPRQDPAAARNSRTAPANASGCSRWG